MRIARSTCCRVPKGSADDTAPVEAMHAIEDAFKGDRARLRDHGLVGSTARRGNPCYDAVIETS